MGKKKTVGMDRRTSETISVVHGLPPPAAMARVASNGRSRIMAASTWFTSGEPWW